MKNVHLLYDSNKKGNETPHFGFIQLLDIIKCIIPVMLFSEVVREVLITFTLTDVIQNISFIMLIAFNHIIG